MKLRLTEIESMKDGIVRVVLVGYLPPEYNAWCRRNWDNEIIFAEATPIKKKD